jgi:hypothetical protein
LRKTNVFRIDECAQKIYMLKEISISKKILCLYIKATVVFVYVSVFDGGSYSLFVPVGPARGARGGASMGGGRAKKDWAGGMDGEGPGKGELNGCIMHQVHISVCKGV